MIIGSFCAGMEKYHSNTRFAPFRDAPFALRGKILHEFVLFFVLLM